MGTTDDLYPGHFADAVALTLDASLDLLDLRTRLVRQAGALIERGVFSNARRILLAGSGDSLFAATCVVPAFRRWTGLNVEAMSALQLARYEAPVLTSGDIVVAVSNSGGSSRTRESVQLARDKGVPTLGVTGTADGPLARLAEHVLVRAVRRPEALPGRWARVFLNMSEYLATLHALYELALAIGRSRGRLDGETAIGWRDELARATTALPGIAARIEPQVADLAGDLAQLAAIWIVGAGPNRGTAAYSAAKFHEQVPLAGIHQDLEEWAHLEYFLTLAIGAQSVVLVLAPEGNASDRAAELVRGIVAAGGLAIVVTGHADSSFGPAHVLLATGEELPELVTPMAYHLPAQLLTLHLARLRGVPHIPLRRRDDYELIRGGVVRKRISGLG
jgi:glucosamine--fructose-6-phosphate aminotransferase (isomerizing)